MSTVTLMKIKRVLFVINFYINTTPNYPNNFDHPVLLKDIKNIAIYRKMLKSFEDLKVPENIELKFLFFAIGTDAQLITRDKYLYGYSDGLIKKAFKTIIENYNIDYDIITNSDLKKIPKINNIELFVNSQDYGAIRNLGFVYANIYNSDLLVQIDSDEIVPKDYLKTVIDVVENNDVHIFSGFYVENNSVFPSAKDTLKTWAKFSYMSKDIQRFEINKLTPAIYAKGGNMVFTREFFSKMCYPGYVVRGEDFSLALLSWIIYKNGNNLAGIQPNNPVFKAYFYSSMNMAIGHHPLKQANNNQLLYLFKNMLRFAFDRNVFLNQNLLTKNDLKSLGIYMYEMIRADNYIEFIKKVFNEFKSKFSKTYGEKEILRAEKALITSVIAINKRNLFNEYKEFQKKYIDFINSSKQLQIHK